MLLIAHKNAGHETPENSLEGFEYALSLAVDGIEIDVHLCQDRQFVVFHDPVLGPHNGLLSTTNQPLVIAQTSLVQLLSCQNVNPRFNKTVAVASLEQVLTVYKNSPRDKTLFIEIKAWDKAFSHAQHYAGLDHASFYAASSDVAASLIELLNRYEISNNIVFISFDRDLLLALKAQQHEHQTFNYGLVYNGNLNDSGTELIPPKLRYTPDYAEARQWLETHAIDVFLPHFEQLAHADFNQSYKDHMLAQPRNFKIISWTPNNEAQWRQAEQYQLDGIITDCPSKYRALTQFSNN